MGCCSENLVPEHGKPAIYPGAKRLPVPFRVVHAKLKTLRTFFTNRHSRKCKETPLQNRKLSGVLLKAENAVSTAHKGLVDVTNILGRY